jgi:murein DD-endopeptidase MepM/ murein hydrolase activator NlpD
VGQGGIKIKLQRALDRAFVDREITVRSDGRTQKLRLSRRVQMALVSTGVALVAWAAVAGGGLVWQGRQLAEQSQRIQRHQAVQEELMAEQSEGLSEVKSTEAMLRDRNQQLRAAFEAQLREMKDSYQTRLSATESSYGAQLEAKDLALIGAKNRGERLARERDQFRGQADSLTRRLEELSEARQSVVDRLIERTLADIEALERTVALTELDFEAVMDRTKIEPLSQGGPFLPIAIPSNRSKAAHFQSSMGLLDLHLDRWEALNKAVRRIPLAAPLDEYRVSSRYGIRKDPVNGKRAKHDGLDLKAPRRTMVFSPASGTVAFAGWKGHYGRVVEIDHGSGIRTLYAHLHKILVEKGEVVEVSDRIGLVGNSGRTTGSHLHYEVQVNGRPTDPIKFINAGKRAVQ